MANAWRDAKKNPDGYSPADFLPAFGNDAEEKAEERRHAKLRALERFAEAYTKAFQARQQRAPEDGGTATP